MSKYTGFDVYLQPVSVLSKQIITKIKPAAVGIITAVIMCCTSQFASAQYVDSLRVGKRPNETLKGFYEIPARDIKYLLSETGSFSQKEWKGLYIASTNTLQLMLFFDKPIDQWIKKRPRSVAGVMWRDIARVGHTYDEPTVFRIGKALEKIRPWAYTDQHQPKLNVVTPASS